MMKQIMIHQLRRSKHSLKVINSEIECIEAGGFCKIPNGLEQLKDQRAYTEGMIDEREGLLIELFHVNEKELDMEC